MHVFSDGLTFQAIVEALEQAGEHSYGQNLPNWHIKQVENLEHINTLREQSLLICAWSMTPAARDDEEALATLAIPEISLHRCSS
jgi:rhamnogalacturonyl hydrolase YesR